MKQIQLTLRPPIARILLSGLFLVSLILNGCTAFHLREANTQLIDLYRAKVEVEEKKEWSKDQLMLPAHIHQGFITLARDAFHEAQRSGTAPLNKIAFHRIGATAAWQAMTTATGPAQRQKSKDLMAACAQKGCQLCDKGPWAPRDCAMLKIIPTLAGLDECRDLHQTVQAQTDGGNMTIAPETVTTLFDREIRALEHLIQVHKGIEATPVHPRVLSKIQTIIHETHDPRLKNSLFMVEEKIGADAPEFLKRKTRFENLRLPPLPSNRQ